MTGREDSVRRPARCLEEVSQVITVPPPANAAQALGMLRSAMSYLAAVDATAMAAETQAQSLQALEQVNSISTAARTSILAAFTVGQGYCADADYSPRAWLINRTKVTRGAAVGYTAWVRRAAAHPGVAAALAAGEMSESYARTICTWTDKLPEDCREDADEILLTAAGTGMDLRDLAGLAGEIYARSLPGKPDEDRDEAFRGPVGAAGDDVRRRGGAAWGPDGGVRRGGGGGAGCAVGPGGRGGHPQPGAAVPRRAGRGDAAAGDGRAAAGAGRAAGQGVDDRAGRQRFADAATAWLDRKAIAEGTKRNYRSILDAHVNPAIGDRTLAYVANDRDIVQDLLTQTMAHLSYSRRKVARQIITDVLDEAVIAGRISSHRIKGIGNWSGLFGWALLSGLSWQAVAGSAR